MAFSEPAGAFLQTGCEYGGFFEARARVFPKRPNRTDTHASAAGQAQLWTRCAMDTQFSWRGTLDFRIDTHHDVDRRRWFDLSQRQLQQPAGALRELYLEAKLGRLDLRLGKQEIRWGRADGFNPTDNLIPYDYLDLFSEERIPAPAIKADIYAGQARLEAVWVPIFTPTRLPLLNQRWFPGLPTKSRISSSPAGEPVDVDLTYKNGEIDLPSRTFKNGSWALRWNQLTQGREFSFSYLHGFDDLPFFHATGELLPGETRDKNPRYLVGLTREYYRLKVAGADFASNLGPFGIRGETAYFDQSAPNRRDYLLFVLGVDRTWGDWFAILQYAGQKVAGKLSEPAVFPELGMRSTLIYRVEGTLSPSRSIEIQGALRLRDGDLMLQPRYNVALANKWRLKIGATFFAGSRSSFLGQYHENSDVHVELRYSF